MCECTQVDEILTKIHKNKKIMIVLMSKQEQKKNAKYNTITLLPGKNKNEKTLFDLV